MVKKILTKLAVAKKKGKNALYRSPRIYLSTKLTDDSSFPFKEGNNILVKIQGKKLVIEKYSKKRRKRK
ncbi:hypothetical protein KEJ50_06885 [Candidatus Bathyarchaeota archaeon]|nr:hypothetical protein [Candidatus Bathyarchaeota archaeon]